MITVKPGQYVRCNTIGDPTSSNHEGIYEYPLTSEEDVLRGWGPDYGIVDGVPCNLHNCVQVSAPSFTLPALTLELLKQGKVHRDDYYPRTVIEILEKEGYTHLGWLNDGVNPPGLNDWMEQYRNQSGSYTIMVSHQFRLIYCVDMGD